MSSIIIGKPRITKIMLAILGFFGLWLPDTTLKYHVYSGTLHFVFTFCYTTAMVVALFFSPSAEQLMTSAGMIMTLVALNVKVLNIYINHRMVRRALTLIEDFELHDEQEVRLKTQRVRMFSIVAAILYCTGNTAGLSTYLAAQRARQLLYVAWYPLDVGYWWAYGYQVVGMLMLSNVNMTMELLPSYLMYMVSIKMEIVGVRLRKLGNGVTHRGHFGDRETVEQFQSSAQLAHCIRAHQSILECTQQIEESFTLGIFAQISASAVIICTLAIQLTFTNPNDGMEQYAYYITFFMSIVAQCFLPCYFGHELITRSEELLNCGYAGDWHQMSPRFRSMLMVFLERVKRTSVIQAGKLFPLSLETFRSIMSFTYKLYALVANLK